MRRFHLDIDRLVESGQRRYDPQPSYREPVRLERPRPVGMQETARELAHAEVDVPRGEAARPERRRPETSGPDVGRLVTAAEVDVPRRERVEITRERREPPRIRDEIRDLIEAADRSETEWRRKLGGRQRDAYRGTS